MTRLFNLKAAVEREKAVQAIDVHRACKNGVVTFWVMSPFSHLQGVVQTFVIQLLFLGLRVDAAEDVHTGIMQIPRKLYKGFEIRWILDISGRALAEVV